MGAFPGIHAGHPQPQAQLTQLTTAYRFTGTPNGEIAMRWYPLAERSGYAAARPAMGAFLSGSAGAS